MHIGVLGTSSVGRALAGAWSAHGHTVVMGTRDPDATLARTEADAQGNPPLSVWMGGHHAVRLATFEEAVGGAEVVVNALAGGASVTAIESLADHLEGTVLLDVGNVLDFGEGWPPRVVTAGGPSLAEQLQSAAPMARVVKSLNTMKASVMIAPDSVADGDHTVFVSGDDAAAKQVVTRLLDDLGWQDILDLGGLATARAAESYFAMWAALVDATGTQELQIKILR